MSEENTLVLAALLNLEPTGGLEPPAFSSYSGQTTIPDLRFRAAAKDQPPLGPLISGRLKAGSRRTRLFHARGSAARPGSAG